MSAGPRSEPVAALLDAAGAVLAVDPGRVRVSGGSTLVSAYPVTALATASVAAAGAALVGLLDAQGVPGRGVQLRRAQAEAWFGQQAPVVDGDQPELWDPVAGPYRTRDGWIRLHTNAPAHRRAALTVLGVPPDRSAVEAAVSGWAAAELEHAIVSAGGAAAQLRSAAQWAAHPQGRAVAAEPWVDRVTTGAGPVSTHWTPTPGRPLAGLRVLDLTRVLAGPTATQLLAWLGAQVLRIDPPDWDEPGVVPLVMWGKRTARVDARSVAGAERLAALLAEADVLVHGYRPGALEHLGLGPEQREALRPGLVDVAVCAYGWTGPWSGRRGFDSLVQFSAGIAHTGMRAAGADRPVSLPVQALDYATGYLAGAAALAGLTGRLRDGLGSRWRLSLARTAVELERAATLPDAPAGTSGRVADEVRRTLVGTPIGGIALAAPPFEVDGVVLDPGALGAPLGRDAPRWG